MSQTVGNFGKSLSGRKGGERPEYPCEDFFRILDEQEARKIQRLRDLHERKLCQTVDKHKNFAKQLSSATTQDVDKGVGPSAKQGPSQGRKEDKQPKSSQGSKQKEKTKSSANQTKKPPEPAAVKARVQTTAPTKSSSVPSKLRRSFPIRDELDFLLNSTFRPDLEVFPHKSDVFRQPETIGCDDRYTHKCRPPVGVRCAQTEGVWFDPSRGQGRKGPKNLGSTRKVGNQGQSLVIGGVDEKRSIFNVKMGIAPDHMSRAMAGYTRKDDGSFYSV
uniref:Uncharacterized protein n=1 Tax=Timema bartmani TaxID=61472 RepID=A0A7R9I7I4_9NEOP|nr:unnamed protein product [Timema bartmani]